MAMVTTDSGDLELLDKLLKDPLSTDENLILKLYKNNHTPTNTSVIGDFTVADFTNYVQKTITRSGWNAATTVSGKAVSTYGSTFSWTCGATGNTVYGYTIEAATSNVLLYGELFASPRVLTNGEILNLTPVFSLSQSCS